MGIPPVHLPNYSPTRTSVITSANRLTLLRNMGRNEGRG